MKVIPRYLYKEFLRLFFFSLLVFLAIYLTVDFIQKVDDLVEAHAPVGVSILYFLYKMPYLVVQMVPAAVLISVIVMFSVMRKNNEITSLKASGVSVLSLSVPVLSAALAISAAVFLLSEVIVPYTSTRGTVIWETEVKKQGRKHFYGRDDIWYRTDRAIYWIRYFDPDRVIMHGVALYFFDQAFHLVKVIEGRRARWTGSRWRMEEGFVETACGNGEYRFTRFSRMDLDLSERPELFLRPVRQPEEMSYWQLKRFARGIRRQGYNATRYLVDMNIKLSFPLVSLIMVLIGIPISLGLKRGGTPLSVSLGMGVCFLYLATFGLARSLGISGLFPPVLSAWLANLVFFFAGVYLLMRVRS